MSGIATAVIGGAIIGGAASVYSSKKSAEAAEEAANTSAGSQREALDYLKEVEAVPREYREGALNELGGLFGLSDDPEAQAAFYDSLSSSPLYKAIIGNKAQGEDAIMRTAGATGGLRSGNTEHALYDYNVQLENQALMETYKDQVSGLTGLAGLPSYASEIAGLTTGIGQTQAQGMVAAANARQTGIGQAASMGMTGLNTWASMRANTPAPVMPEVTAAPTYTTKNLTSVSI